VRPEDARWTKISRDLVNPAALEEGGERFEESPDFVIVLRVLSKDEIDYYTKLTEAIRSIRSQPRPRRHEEPPRTRRKAEVIQDRAPPPSTSNAMRTSYDPPTSKSVQPRSSTAAYSTAATAGLSGSGLRENPDAPGTYIGYRRNPPPPGSQYVSYNKR
jgi:hypothetical protein